MKRIDAPVVWMPIPGSQALAVDTRCHITGYFGTRGPGKTDAQIMLFRRYVGAGYGKHWRGVIFDREYKNLDDIIAKTKRWFPQFRDGARFKESKGDLKWAWPGGEELLLRAISKPADYQAYHGHEYPFIGVNELTKYPTSEVFDMLLSLNRSSFVSDTLPSIPLKIFVTSNPWGPGHNWVKRRFIDPAPYGVPIRVESTLDKPGGKPGEKVTVTRTQVSLFGSWRENPYLDPAYIAGLMGEKDASRRKAWLDGNWDIVAGGALDDVWDRRIHVVPRFPIPRSWQIVRAYDHGSSHPHAVVWGAVASGEEATVDGKTWCPPRGTVIVCGEWYGTEEIGTNKGLKLPIAEIARGIVEREKSWLSNGWIARRPSPGPADNQIFDLPRVEVGSIADEFERHGVEWTRSNKSPGSRVRGLQSIRNRLWASREQAEQPGLYFMSNCASCLATIPILPRDERNPDDVATDCEDHLYDALRYLLVSVDKPSAGASMKVEFAA